GLMTNKPEQISLYLSVLVAKMNFTQIKETCLYTIELERAEKFYSEILELEKIGKTKGEYVFFRAGSSVLLIFNPEYTSKQKEPPAHEGFGRIHLAFEIDSRDFEKCKSNLQKKGVKIIQEKLW